MLATLNCLGGVSIIDSMTDLGGDRGEPWSPPPDPKKKKKKKNWGKKKSILVPPIEKEEGWSPHF
jgi:hypothetical protein